MKKALALLLVFVLALGMTTTAFAAKGPIDKDSEPNWLGGGAVSVVTSQPNDSTDLGPGDTMSVALDQDMFASQAMTVASWGNLGTGVSRSDVTRSGLSVRSKVKKGAICIDDVYLDFTGDRTTGGTNVVVEMVNPFPSVKDIDFEVDVYFVIDGKSYPRATFVFDGNLSNDTFEIDKNTYYAYLSDGSIAEVKDYVKEVEYEVMDNGGVIVKGPAIKGQKYWAVADNEPTNAEAEIMDKYDIAEIIKIKAIGLDRIAKSVTLDIANPSDYVYDGDLNYLGRAKDPLDFSSVYYLSATMLDVEEEVEPEDEVEEEEEVGDDYELPSESGGEGYLDNINDNPGTGK